MSNRPGGSRQGPYRGPKNHIVGNTAGRAAPAWRTNGQNGHGPSGSGVNGIRAPPVDAGSKVLLSNLPQDVGETEVSDLMKKTVGPLKDTFIIYNSQGRSKGMAVVHFSRTQDASVAKDKYNGKVIDGRKAIRIEIIVDSIQNAVAPAPAPPPKPKSLFDRIGQAPPQAGNQPVAQAPQPQSRPFRQNRPPQNQAQAQNHNSGNSNGIQIGITATRQRLKVRTKKGPRRVKKSVADLDKEMEEYRKDAEAAGVSGYAMNTQ